MFMHLKKAAMFLTLLLFCYESIANEIIPTDGIYSNKITEIKIKLNSTKFNYCTHACSSQYEFFVEGTVYIKGKYVGSFANTLMPSKTTLHIPLYNNSGGFKTSGYGLLGFLSKDKIGILLVYPTNKSIKDISVFSSVCTK